jgi:aspartate aminotransferase-like enzyme
MPYLCPREKEFGALITKVRGDLLAVANRAASHTAVPAPWSSGLLTAFYEPDVSAWSFDGLHDWLFERGITVYPGKIPGMRSFRIATMGDLRPADIEVALGHIRAYCQEIGWRGPRFSGQA